TPAPVHGVTLSKGHLDLAREAARASLVLLKNDGDTLPLARDTRSIALIGPLADDPHNPLGTRSFDGDRSASVTVLAALRERLGATARIEHLPGGPDARSSDTSGFGAAFEAVKRADVAIVVLGEDGNISGECRSRAYLDLP